MLLSNRKFPRNISDQLRFLKKLDHTEKIERNIIILAGHVAIAISKSKIIHSNSFRNRVEIENVKDAIKGLKNIGPHPCKKITIVIKFNNVVFFKRF